ncbi:hypothetical protein ISCGN_020558 [Ixodes scapularis]
MTSPNPNKAPPNAECLSERNNLEEGNYRGQRGRHGGRLGGERHHGHRCHYPRDCSRPSMGEEEDDDDRGVNTTAIFNNATRMCESTAQTSGPRDCAKFVTLEFCQMVCGNVTQP